MLHFPFFAVIGKLLPVGFTYPRKNPNSIRYDRYHIQLSPGDLIVWANKDYIYSGRIHSFTPAGTLRVFERNSLGQYAATTRTVITQWVVKVESFPDGKSS